MAEVPTVRVVNPSNPDEFIIINESDYDPDEYTLWEERGVDAVVLWDLTFEDQAAVDLAEQELDGPEDFEGIEPTGGTDEAPAYRATDVSDAIAALGDEDDAGEEEHPEEDGFEGADPDPISHDLTLEELRAELDGIENPDLLRAIRNGEEQHPEYEGGREGALEMIDEHLEELEE